MRQALYNKNEIENNTLLYCIHRGVMQLNAVLEVTFFTLKLEKFVGGSLSHFWCLACQVVEFDYKSLFNTGWQ